MADLRQRAIFVVRKTRIVSNMFMLGWGLRIPFVSKDRQQALRRRLLDLRASKPVKALRLWRGEVKGHWSKVNGSIDRNAEAKAREAIDAGGVISFDFYDTLFTRVSATPEDVIAYIGHVLRLEGLDPAGDFARTRLKADATARIADTRGDITLAQIYAAFPDPWGAARRDRALAIELRLEHRVLRPRRSVVALSRSVRQRGGSPIIVSDTCMDGAFIRSVLETHGLTDAFDGIYCSSDVLRRKDNGTIWPWLRQTALPKAAGYTHMGDNPRSDVVQPTKFGWKAVGLTSAAVTAELRGFPMPRHWRSTNHDWRTGIALGPAIATMGNDPFVGLGSGPIEFERAADFGYSVIGPLMFGFLSWIIQRAGRDGVDRLFFLSRDGYFLQKIYEACTAGATFRTPAADYLCVSRRSAMPANLYRTDDPTLLLKSKFKGSLKDLIMGRLGIDIARFAGADTAGQATRLPQDRARVTQFMADHRDTIREQLKVADDTMMRYLDQVGFMASDRSALVDFSSSGTIQLALQSIVQRATTGYYMMISRAFGSEDGFEGRSFACYVDAHDQWELRPVQAGAILLEGLLTAPYGQITGYRFADGQVVPVYDAQPDSGSHFEAIRQTMEGAQRYCEDLVAAYGGEVLLVDAPKGDLQRPLKAFLNGRLKMPKTLRDAITVEDDFGGNGKMAFYA